MKEKLLPQWLIDLTMVLYRFMCAGFGKKVPRPYYGNFCGPFWAVFFTYVVPLLAPFVLIAIVVRLVFGKRRGEKMGDIVVSSGSYLVATKTRAISTSLVIIALLAIPIVMFWAVAWEVLAIIGIILSVAALLWLGLGWISDNSDKLDFLEGLFDRIAAFWNRLPKLVRRAISSPILLIVAIMTVIVTAIEVTYENYCPLVRESS